MLPVHPPCVAFTGVIREHLPDLEPFRSEGRYDRNQVIYSPEDLADEIYLIDSGRVKLQRVSSEGREKIFAIYQPGDFFGELCICGGGLRREDQAVALEATHTTSFKVQAVLQLVSNKPRLALDLLTLVCKRLAEYQDQIATLSFDPIPRRLAKELLHLWGSVGSSEREGGQEAGLQFTHDELAKLVSTSREVVTSVMNQFRQQGLLEYGRRNIMIYPPRLEEYLEKTDL